MYQLQSLLKHIQIYNQSMSSFGKLFRVMTFGESHSHKVGCVIEGFPSNFKIDISQIQRQLNRRRPGQSYLTTPRDQKDKVECVSGLENQITLGSPLCFLVNNQNVKKKDYSSFQDIPRPGHADFTYLKKYGIKASSGGGRSSARQTIGRVIAGGLAKQYLKSKGIKFASWVSKVNQFSIPEQFNNKLIQEKIQIEQIENLGNIIEKSDHNILVATQNPNQFYQFQNRQGQIRNLGLCQHRKLSPDINPTRLRCPHPETAAQIYWKIKEVQKQNNSIGGIVQGAIYNLPVGLGQPCFDKFPAMMAHAMMSIPATKGFQYGSGFSCSDMTGQKHNDLFHSDLTLQTNNSGGTLGGITTGQTFNFKVAFKPVSSIAKPQLTHDFQGNKVTLETKGRHDPCVLPRAPPIIDNMAAIVTMDMLLRKNNN